jgi:hypothetical protein
LPAESDLSGSSTALVESGEEEASQPHCIKPADGGALEDLFGDMTFWSFPETDLSQERDSESFTSFDSVYTNNSIDSKVFTDPSNGVTRPEFDESAKYHQICIITGACREADEELEAFDDLGNPYIDPADLTRETGGKYIGHEPREKVRLPQEACDIAARAMDGTEPMTTQVSPATLQAYQYKISRSRHELENYKHSMQERLQ